MGPRLLDIAARQAGLFTFGQAMATGMSPATLRRRLESGAVTRPERGVYRVSGHPVRPDETTWRAILSVHESAVVSHESAAAMHELAPAPDQTHVTVVAARWRRRHDVRVHRSRDLAPGHVTLLGGVPLTTPARTLMDCAAGRPRWALAALVDEALRRRLTDIEELDAILADVARQGRPGVTAMRRVLDERRLWTEQTDSVLEDSFRRIVERAGLPIPLHQHEVHDGSGAVVARIDFAYPHARLAIEIDGYRFHHDAASFVRDRRRQNDLQAAGYRILRFTAHDLGEPDAVAAAVRRMLAA